jgi:hypothetical protein
VIDLGRLAKVLGMCGSAHEAEALTAMRLAIRLMQEAGTNWQELLKPQHDLEIAIAACRRLQDENEKLQARLEDKPIAIEWNEFGTCQENAAWALDAQQEGQLRLSQFEASFLTTVSGWRGSLTAKQQSVFDTMMPAILRRAGIKPQWGNVA